MFHGQDAEEIKKLVGRTIVSVAVRENKREVELQLDDGKNVVINVETGLGADHGLYDWLLMRAGNKIIVRL